MICFVIGIDNLAIKENSDIVSTKTIYQIHLAV